MCAFSVLEETQGQTLRRVQPCHREKTCPSVPTSMLVTMTSTTREGQAADMGGTADQKLAPPVEPQKVRWKKGSFV